MKKTINNATFSGILFILAIAFAAPSSACTNYIVGKDASKTGAVMCTYSADSYGSFGSLHFIPAAKHAPGERYEIYDYDTNKHHGSIPQVPETYNVVGHINNHKVSIMETTFGGRHEVEQDSTGLIDYGSLMYLGLMRAKTAREAIKVMTSLVEQYGYASEGESFSVCDANEAWILEMISQGHGSKKVVWVAQRIPDNAISGHANQARIRKVNLKDKENVMISKECISFARKMGWFSGKDADFSFADVYAPADFSGRRICDARVWTFFRRHSTGMDKYFPWVEGKAKDAEPMPLWVVPTEKVSLEDLRTAMRDHYEGTPFAISTAADHDNTPNNNIDEGDPGKGIWNMPYRPTPLYFKYNGKEYFNERHVSTQQAHFSIISELRSWMPDEVGAVLWWANDDCNMVPYTPLYGCLTKAPRPYDTPGADDTHFSFDNAFWVCNWVSNMVYPRYSVIFPELKAVRDSIDNNLTQLQKSVEEKAVAMNDANAQAAFLTDYSCQKADEMLARWKQLAVKIIVKYNDMVIKKEKNGVYEKTPYGLAVPPIRPGYTEDVKKAISEYGNGRYAKPEE
ncbi:MAG: C69 family dipeptidase [Bacteroidaceae bacterium]|nr:C69 family dipeptidase [Bacteroidaceae bacterium]